MRRTGHTPSSCAIRASWCAGCPIGSRTPVAIPDLTRSGYRFMGGRVVATTHGPAGLLMYDDDRGTRVVLLIRPMAVERDTPMAPHTSGALRGYSWAAHGIGYSVVAAAAPETLHPLADEVRRQIAG
jgi:anti-sigma factor RsiW